RKLREMVLILSSSVAIKISSASCDMRARSYTHWIRGFPPISTRGFPGNRLEAYRAGMTITLFMFSVRSDNASGMTPYSYPRHGKDLPVFLLLSQCRLFLRLPARGPQYNQHILSHPCCVR